MERQFAFSKFIIVKDKTLMLNLHQTEMVRVIIQDEERHVPEVDKNTSFNVPEIRIDNTEDLQDEWEMEMESGAGFCGERGEEGKDEGGE